MLLSICIPTHHGRDWSLGQAVEAMLDQIESDGLSDLVEVCVSDNASEDSTAELMAAAIKRAPNNVTYYHSPVDLYIYNFVNVVRLAKGDYCWLFGSDDMPAPGALKEAVAILRQYPDCSGITCAFEIYDREMKNILPSRPAGVFPSHMETPRQFETFESALVELSMAQTFMSAQIFRREQWRRCLAAEPRDFIYYAPGQIHTYLITRMMQADPRWVWWPGKLVHMRADNDYAQGLISSVSWAHAVNTLRHMTKIWTLTTGSNRALFRAVLRKGYRVDWSPSVVRHSKMLPYHKASDDRKMLVEYTRYLASLPDFWWGSFLALLIPHWFWKALRGSGVLRAAKRVLLGRTEAA